MKTPNLKPCPFCGGEATIDLCDMPYSPVLYAVHCINSDCAVYPSTEYYKDQAFAIEAWNRRVKDENA